MQICRKCQQDTPARMFPRQRCSTDGLDSHCKACHQQATAGRVAAQGHVQHLTVSRKVGLSCSKSAVSAHYSATFVAMHRCHVSWACVYVSCLSLFSLMVCQQIYALICMSAPLSPLANLAIVSLILSGKEDSPQSLHKLIINEAAKLYTHAATMACNNYMSHPSSRSHCPP